MSYRLIVRFSFSDFVFYPAKLPCSVALMAHAAHTLLSLGRTYTSFTHFHIACGSKESAVLRTCRGNRPTRSPA